MREGDGTKFTIDRKIFSSDIWFSSPWKLKIWIYLIGKANHKDGDYMGIPIKRGQLIRGLRTIQKDCAYKIGYRIKKPSLSTVRRICEELTKDGRTTQRTTQQGTLFTICNYNDLQSFRNNERNSERTSYETVGEQNNNVKNDNNKNNREIDFKFNKAIKIPPDIFLTNEMMNYAKKQGCQDEAHIRFMFENFKNWFGGTGRKYQDWTKTFYNWVLKDKKEKNPDKYKILEDVG